MNFWLYAGCSLASLIFVLLYLHETKGRALDEIKLIFDSAISEPLPFQYSTKQKNV